MGNMEKPFAAATQPVMTQTVIKTDAAGLAAGEAKLSVKGQEVPLYYAHPDGKSNLPVVLVVPEIFGLHEHIRDIVRRFAKQGYFAVAPDLFVRQGDPTQYQSVQDILREVIAKVPSEQVMSDLDACIDWAAGQGGNIDKAGVTGFCWGGTVVWMYCHHNPRMKAGVAWYGKVVGAKTPLTPLFPLDIAPQLQVPVLGLYGAKDTGIPLDTVEAMTHALAQGASGSEIVVYPNSGHAFNADYRPSYVAEDARDGWSRCLAWFKSHGVA